MAESYKFFLNTNNAVNNVNPVWGQYIFYVNWEAFLPKKYSQYQVNFSYQRNGVQLIAFGDVEQVSITLGSTNSTDQKYGGTTILGAFNPSFYYIDNTGGAYCTHTGTTYTNTPTVINYPTNSYIRATVPDINGNDNPYLSTTMLLFLTFTPIKPNQIVRQVKIRTKDKHRFKKKKLLLKQ